MPAPIYGRVVTGTMVRTAVEETIKKWQRDYLAQMSVLYGHDLPLFRSFVPAVAFDKFEDDQLPACVTVAPGLADQPVRRRDGRYDVAWSVGVGAVVMGQDRDSTWKLGEHYAAAVRLLMLQHSSLGGFASGLTWVTEAYGELDFEDSRSAAGVSVSFIVDIQGVADASQGPTEPTPEADPVPVDTTWNTVASHIVTVVKET